MAVKPIRFANVMIPPLYRMGRYPTNDLQGENKASPDCPSFGLPPH